MEYFAIIILLCAAGPIIIEAFRKGPWED